LNAQWVHLDIAPSVHPMEKLERRVYAAAAWLGQWLPPEGGVPEAI